MSYRTLFIRQTNERTLAFTGLLDGAKKVIGRIKLVFLLIFPQKVVFPMLKLVVDR